jgi:hypothetical protein
MIYRRIPDSSYPYIMFTYDYEGMNREKVLQWSYENFGAMSDRWKLVRDDTRKFLPIIPPPIMYDWQVWADVFYFRDKNDAMRFKLVWG